MVSGDPAVLRRVAEQEPTVIRLLGVSSVSRFDRLTEEANLADLLDGVSVYHAGTRVDESGVLRVNGGRVLNVTAVAGRFADAQQRSREAAERIQFDGRQLRRWTFTPEQITAAIAVGDEWQLDDADGAHRLVCMSTFRAPDDDEDESDLDEPADR